MQRINIIGTSGSGKSTFARQLAQKLGYPYIEMDSLAWDPNWTEAELSVFENRLAPHLSKQNWVLDGNYNKVQELKWTLADTVIWLDYPFAITLYRAIKRAIGRAWSGKEVWPGTGNVETFKRTFFSRKSIIWWTIITHHQNRRKNIARMQDPRWQHIRFIRLQSTKQTHQWLDGLKELNALTP